MVTIILAIAIGYGIDVSAFWFIFSVMFDLFFLSGMNDPKHIINWTKKEYEVNQAEIAAAKKAAEEK